MALSRSSSFTNDKIVNKSNKRITIVDIAKELAVSPSLVSMVLSGNGKKNRISEKASKRVTETAKRMGYNPNLLARALRTGKTGVLGLIVADISNPFFATLARLIENEASRYGYGVMFASSDEEAEKFNKIGNVFITKQVDGLIIVPVKESMEIISEWHSRNIPIVSIDRYYESLNIPYVVSDNFDASYTMIKYLRKKGHNKIAFIVRNTNISNFKERECGFLACANHLSLSSEQFHVFKLDNDNWKKELQIIIDKILTEGFDVIFFGQNMLGVEGLRILNKLKIQIPDNLGVISFDNSDVFEFNKPRITCFEQPLKKLAETTLVYLTNIIDDKIDDKQTYAKFKGRLIIRESC